MEYDKICEPAPPGDNNDGVVSDNIAAASPVAETSSVSEALSSLSALLKQYFLLSSGLEGQRVRPEDRPVKNPWSVL